MNKSELRLCRLIYYSSPSPHLMDSDVDAILEEAIRRNGRCGITGLLAYDAFHFMQILEGEDEAVNTLYLSIAADPRHYDIRLILYQQIEERRFSEWSMALAKLPDVPGRYIDKLYGGFKPQRFSPEDALKYFDMLRHYLQRAA
ncbi:BLUF domain-containing protein [Marinobacter sp.]|uniref:BLUF domain-containing protein n=1 Tax=Marinobacter sp. TaxID=50741 RepID=UPI002355515B|nr:BLUF domain-containing protein [Marinobacter sp.]